MKLIVNKYKLLGFVFLFLIFFYLEFVYKTFVFNSYEYMGFLYEFNLVRYIETKILFSMVMLTIYYKTPSPFLFSIELIFVLFMFIPSLIIHEFMFSPRFIIYSIVFFVLLLHFSGFIKLNIKYPKISEKQSLLLLVIIVVLLLFPIVARYKFNLNLNVLKFQNIYDIRSEAVLGSSAIVGYVYGWLAKVILPILIAFSMIKKRFGLALFGIIVLMYLFMVQAHKTVFFSILIVLVFYLFKDYYKKTSLFIVAVFTVFILTRILTITTGEIAPESVIVRRIFFVPALLNTYYFDFFNHNHLYLSHSIFKNFIEYPYDVTPPSIIGENYLGSVDTHANNGFISDGYMNFGYLGVIIYSFLLVLIIKILDTLKISSRYFGTFFVMIFTLISSAFLTSLLTHGILILIILAVFIMQEQKN